MASVALQRSQSALFNRPQQRPAPTAAKDDLELIKPRAEYQVLEILSNPSPHADAVVKKVRQLRTGEEFAAKIYKSQKNPVFRFHREVTFLSRIRSFPHALQLKGIAFIDKRPTILTELVGGKNLYEQITGLSSGRIIDVIYRILEFLERADKAGLIHGDLKPENVLLCANGQVKIIDPELMQDMRKPLQRVIQTRFYRAPEVVLGKGEYGPRADVWSVGCMLYELYAQRPLFYSKGRDSDEAVREHLQRIVERLGPPPVSYLKKFANSKKFFTATGSLIKPLKLPKETPWRETIRAIGKKRRDPQERVDHLIDLINKMVCYTERISAAEALKHPLFARSKEDHKARK